MSFKNILAPIASIVGVTLIGIVIFLGVYSWPAVKFNGFSFVVKNDWNLGNLYANPVMHRGHLIMPGAQYGILFLIVATLLSTLIAVVLAVPLGVGSAIFLSDGVPAVLRPWLSFFVELLAAVPSVVYGLWGYAAVIPLLSHTVFPWMAKHLAFIPFFAGDTGSGYGLLTSGFVLTLMIVPLITSTMRDALISQPRGLREAALALGATRFETMWSVILPSTRRVLIASSILATGRALGETMAVLMVGGGALNYLPNNIYAPITTMAAFIVSQLDSALEDPTGMAVRSLAEVALVLCVISVIVNGAARLMLYFSGYQRLGGGGWA
jgi:phosphate transport system permease protein